MIRFVFGFFAVIVGAFGVFFFYSFSASHNAEISNTSIVDPMTSSVFPFFGWIITLAVLITGIITVVSAYNSMRHK